MSAGEFSPVKVDCLNQVLTATTATQLKRPGGLAYKCHAGRERSVLSCSVACLHKSARYAATQCGGLEHGNGKATNTLGHSPCDNADRCCEHAESGSALQQVRVVTASGTTNAVRCAT